MEKLTLIEKIRKLKNTGFLIHTDYKEIESQYFEMCFNGKREKAKEIYGGYIENTIKELEKFIKLLKA